MTLPPLPIQAFRGIYPMQYAFFDGQGMLHEAAMRRQARGCIVGGAHGIAVLGLATEVNKLTLDERRHILRWLAEEIAGALPLAVTVSGGSVNEQVDFAEYAQSCGASWLILQPPPQRGRLEDYYASFFDQVMSRVTLPVGIQNAPEYTGVDLGPDSIRRLADAHPNFTFLKGEGPAINIRGMIEAVNGRLAVFNGRGGLELIDNLRAGCAGMIPATDTFDYQVRIFELMKESSDEPTAQRIYAQVLPEIVFTMQSLDTLMCYGKRIAALRLGLGEVYDRQPALKPTHFGLEIARRYAETLGPLP